MLSTFVLLPAAPGLGAPALGALVRTLGSLVPGTVEGLVRDLTIVARHRNEDVRRVADHAGCALVEDADGRRGLEAAVARARSPALFLLLAGAHVDRGCLDEIAQAFDPARAPEEGTALLLRQVPTGLVHRLMPDLSPTVGLIAGRTMLDLSASGLEAMARRIARKRTLVARATMTQP